MDQRIRELKRRIDAGDESAILEYISLKLRTTEEAPVIIAIIQILRSMNDPMGQILAKALNLPRLPRQSPVKKYIDIAYDSRNLNFLKNVALSLFKGYAIAQAPRIENLCIEEGQGYAGYTPAYNEEVMEELIKEIDYLISVDIEDMEYFELGKIIDRINTRVSEIQQASIDEAFVETIGFVEVGIFYTTLYLMMLVDNEEFLEFVGGNPGLTCPWDSINNFVDIRDFSQNFGEFLKDRLEENILNPTYRTGYRYVGKNMKDESKRQLTTYLYALLLE